VIVYVETNFLLELAYLQERCDSCQLILDFTRARTITLALPAFSAAEARATVHRRTSERREVQSTLRRHIREISRSEPFRGLSEQSRDVFTALVAVDGEARERLEAAIQTVEEHGITIPMTGKVIQMARVHELIYSLSSQDALVLASVQSHAEKSTEQKCFISQDLRAFEEPAVLNEISSVGCRFVSNFTDAVGYIRNALRPPKPS
jgi:predicted nucleic acid-binding protein